MAVHSPIWYFLVLKAHIKSESVMELFVVDRRGIYAPGDIIELKEFEDISPKEMATLVTNLFPSGLSTHGQAYFINNKAMIANKTPMIDWCLEFYRRSVFPDKPSRWVSFFAWGNIEDAKKFRSHYGSPKDAIFSVHSDANILHKGDMNLLNNDNAALPFTYLLDLYWKGETISLNPAWEYLCPLPIEIGREIKI